ncbi:MAG: TrmJ/YjtD family RNA methyltransferase, partial [Gammaproteobacteria bacterium]|nr:TrmJ/YjtD family RNA methyltransferase [Gammaproteobacteria bacterium]
PKSFPDEDATARASGADDLLATATVVADLDQALAGCGLVAAVSARQRSLAWPCKTPREAAAEIVARTAHTTVALLFGREKYGLSNKELERCHLLISIPANPEYSSLNLAMAVQLLAYEIRLARGQTDLPPASADPPPATAEAMQRFYQHLEEVLLENGFLDPDNPRQLMRRLRRLFNRAVPDENEINILRGILSAVQRPTGKKNR